MRKFAEAANVRTNQLITFTFFSTCDIANHLGRQFVPGILVSTLQFQTSR